MFAIAQKNALGVQFAQARPDFIQTARFPMECPRTVMPGVIGKTAQQGTSRPAGRFQKQNHLRQLFHTARTHPCRKRQFCNPLTKGISSSNSPIGLAVLPREILYFDPDSTRHVTMLVASAVVSNLQPAPRHVPHSRIWFKFRPERISRELALSVYVRHSRVSRNQKLP